MQDQEPERSAGLTPEQRNAVVKQLQDHPFNEALRNHAVGKPLTVPQDYIELMVQLLDPNELLKQIREIRKREFLWSRDAPYL